MRLTQYTDYAFRVLMYLAAEPDRYCTIAEIAAHYAISRNHLMKVVQHLVQAGYAQGVRGRSGGVRLALPAHSIRLGAVGRSMERDTALVECFQAHGGGCMVGANCRLPGILGGALEAFWQYLDAYTLADLMSGNVSLSLGPMAGSSQGVQTIAVK